VTASPLLATFLFLLSRPSLSGGFCLDSKACVKNAHFFQGGTTIMVSAIKRAVEPGYIPANKRALRTRQFLMKVPGRGR